MKNYIQYCRENGHKVHPARFPETLPEYFIRMLSDPGDLVVDPFGGSCTTGQVAERLGREWICCDLDRSYLDGAVGRFIDRAADSRSKKDVDTTQLELVPSIGKVEVPARVTRMQKRLADLEAAQEYGLGTSVDTRVRKAFESAMKSAIREVKSDLKTPDFRWRTDAVQIAPPCALPADESQPLDPAGGENGAPGTEQDSDEIE